MSHQDAITIYLNHKSYSMFFSDEFQENFKTFTLTVTLRAGIFLPKRSKILGSRKYPQVLPLKFNSSYFGDMHDNWK